MEHCLCGEGYSVRRGYALLDGLGEQLIREISIDYLWSLNAFDRAARDPSDVTSVFTPSPRPHHDALTSPLPPALISRGFLWHS